MRAKYNKLSIEKVAKSQTGNQQHFYKTLYASECLDDP